MSSDYHLFSLRAGEERGVDMGERRGGKEMRGREVKDKEKVEWKMEVLGQQL